MLISTKSRWPRFFPVLLHELVQKCNDFVFSLYLTAETTIMQNEMTHICFTAVQFPCCAFCSMQFILFSTRSISNKRTVIIYKMSQPHVSWKIWKATRFTERNSSESEKCMRNGRNRTALASVKTKVRKIKALIDWKERRDIEWHLRQV